jgi:hypothetical protein
VALLYTVSFETAPIRHCADDAEGNVIEQ